MNKLYIISVLCIGLFIAPGFCQSQKGVWLTDVASEALDSKQGIEEVVQKCKSYGIGQIYVVVWNRGYTQYPSQIMEDTFGEKIATRFEGRDILKELIETAHTEELKVHAWFEFGFSCSYEEEDGGHILRKKPEWKALDSSGKLVTKNGFQWMNAFKPEVQDFVLSLIKEVVQNYDLDGIQGDDRLPANPSIAGYDPYTTALFKKENDGKIPPQDYKDSLWITWRANKLNLFAEKIYSTIKALKPNVKVSMVPSVYPWSKDEYLQDSPTWVENGWVDAIIPQLYRYNIKAYKSTLDSNLEYMPNDSKIPFTPGLLLKVNDYTPSKRFLKKMIRYNRKHGLESEVFFFYEGLKLHQSFFGKTYHIMN